MSGLRPLRPALLACSWLGVLAVAASPGCGDPGSALPHACTLSPPSPPDWRLHADGTVLRDGLGRVVFLRGVDAGGRSKFAPYVPFEYTAGELAPALEAYMDRAASWGIDAMRVPFTWAALEPAAPQGSTHAWDEAWLSMYRQILDAAWKRGIWAVVDFHQDVYAESFCGDGFPSWTIPDAPPPHHDCPNWALEYLMDPGVRAAFDRFWADGSPVQADYLAAWDTMIARFANVPGVAGFEPINEPGWGTQDAGKFEATTLTDFYSRVAAHMHALAPGALVFVDPTGLAGEFLSTQLQRPAGDGIVFAPHFYPIGRTDPATLLHDMQPWADIGKSWNVPVFVGEFGTGHDAAGAAAYMAGDFAALDALGLSGTEWEYSVESTEWNGESGSVVAADGTEYPVASALVRPFARAVAGSDVTQSWDAPSATFTLSFSAAQGMPNVTEVQLPARAYPRGWSVALSDGCYDDTSVPGRLLVQPGDGAERVTVTVTPP